MIIQNNNTKKGLKRLSKLIIIVFVSMTYMSFSQLHSLESENVFQYGKASYYGFEFIGRKTANGDIFNEYEYTCAHKSLPFGTKLKVTNLNNGQSIIVRVNDRGPFVKNRVVDLSIKGAKEIGLMQSGVANVSIEIVNQKYSSLGNVKNMEKYSIDNSYAYVNFDDESTTSKLYDYLQSSNQIDMVTSSEIEIYKNVSPKPITEPAQPQNQ